MIESWLFSEESDASGSSTVPLSPPQALRTLRTRIAAGQFETWLTSSTGRLLATVSNGERAMVMLLDDEADAGEHAVQPGAGGWSQGFVLANGQHDEYPNEDTVPLTEAFRIIDHLLSEGSPPPDTAWAVDR